MKAATKTLKWLQQVPLAIRQQYALELLEQAQQLRQRWLAFEMDARLTGAVDMLAQKEFLCSQIARLLTEELDSD